MITKRVPERHEPYVDREFAFPSSRQRRLDNGEEPNQYQNIREGDVVVVRLDGRKIAGRYYSRNSRRSVVEFDGRDNYNLTYDPCLQYVTEVIGELKQKQMNV
jgi:hypothetical protein